MIMNKNEILKDIVDFFFDEYVKINMHPNAMKYLYDEKALSYLTVIRKECIEFVIENKLDLKKESNMKLFRDNFFHKKGCIDLIDAYSIQRTIFDPKKMIDNDVHYFLPTKIMVSTWKHHIKELKHF